MIRPTRRGVATALLGAALLAAGLAWLYPGVAGLGAANRRSRSNRAEWV